MHRRPSPKQLTPDPHLLTSHHPTSSSPQRPGPAPGQLDSRTDSGRDCSVHYPSSQNHDPPARPIPLSSDKASPKEVVTADSSAESILLRGATIAKTYMSAIQRARWGKRYANRLRRSLYERAGFEESDEELNRRQINFIQDSAHQRYDTWGCAGIEGGENDEDEDDVDDIDMVYRILNDPNMTEFELFTKLPRPSRIVPDIHLSHRADAGMTKIQREAHIRRIQATTLRVDNYDSKGMIMFISSITRQQYGLEQYSPDLVPPPEDRAVNIERVPKKLLSHYYRGKLLTTRLNKLHSRQRRKANASRGRNETVSLGRYGRYYNNAGVGFFENEMSTCNHEEYERKRLDEEASAGEIHDYEYWCPSPVFYEEERKRTQRRRDFEREIQKMQAEKRARDELGEVPTKSRKRQKSYANDSLKSLENMTNIQLARKLLRDESDEDDVPAEISSLPSTPSPSKSRPDAGYTTQTTSASVRNLNNNENDDDDDDEAEDGMAVSVGAQPKSRLMSAQPKLIKKVEAKPLFDELFKTLTSNPHEITKKITTSENVKEEQEIEGTEEKATANPNTRSRTPHENENGKEVDQTSGDIVKTDCKSEDNLKGRDGISGFDPAYNMQGFKKERWLAEEFSKPLSRKSKTFRANNATVNRQQVQPKRPPPNRRTGLTEAKEEPEMQEEPENQGSGMGWNMMKKMGFKRRLGLREDGIAEPVPMSNRLTATKEGVGVSRRIESNPPPDNGSPPNGRPAQENHVDLTRKSRPLSSVMAHRDWMDAMCVREDETQRKRLANREKRQRDEADAKLDPNDEHETDDGTDPSTYDSGRRGIIVDFDMLTTNARPRQLEVLKQLKITLAADPALDKITERYVHDFYDFPLISELLQHMGPANDEETKQSMLTWFDDEFDLREKPVLNMKMVAMLKSWARKSRLYFGVLHRGCVRRARKEIEGLGICDLFRDVSFACVSGDNTWPYIKSTRRLLCRMGVLPAQAIMISQKHETSGNIKVTAGCISGYLLGARTVNVVMSAEKGEVSRKDELSLVSINDLVETIDRSDEVFKISLEVLIDNHYRIVDHLMGSEPLKKRKRLRVMALRAGDLQFHCGVIEYGNPGDEKGESFVRFYPDGDREWVANSSLAVANRRAYRILRKNDFPSLIAPEDVEMLDA